MPQAIQVIQAPIGIVTGLGSGFYREANDSQSQWRTFPVAPPSFVWVVGNWELNLPIRIFSSSPRRHSIAPSHHLYSNTLDVNV